MTALGFTTAAAETVLEPLQAGEDDPAQLTPAASATVTGTGADLCVAQLRGAGVKYMFTNPGSFEAAFFDAFSDTPGIQLILGLHEGVVISMADAYNRVSQEPAFVSVHTIVGTAQMGGQLYNAAKDGSSLVITAAFSDNETWTDEGVLTGMPGFSQKEINRQFTKISWEARSAEGIPLMLRRAFKVAATEPGGPVYLALAKDAIEKKNVTAEILAADRFLLRGKIRPDAASVERCAEWIADARRPLIIAGDEVWRGRAVGDLVAFSERTGVPVFAMPLSGPNPSEAFRNFPTANPNYLGPFGMTADYVNKGTDLMIFLGTHDIGGFVVPTSPEVPSSARIVRIGVDTNWMGRNQATDLALIGDIKETLADISTALGALSSRMKTTVVNRSAEIHGISAAMRARTAAEVRANLGRTPMDPDEFAAIMYRTMAPGTIFATENLSGKHRAMDFGYRENDLMWLGNTGFALGWGIGASMGAQLAAPDRPVVCSIGDGSVMYSASGFWTQARYSIPVLTVIWNNHDYQTVRQAWADYGGKMLKSGHYPGMYLGDPDIDFVKLAESQGVSGEKTNTAAEFEAAMKRGVKTTLDGKPYVIDAEVARFGGGADSTWYQKFSLTSLRKG